MARNWIPTMQKKKALISQGLDLVRGGGDGRDRTADLLIANQSLSQLSYAPRNTDRFYITPFSESKRSNYWPAPATARRKRSATASQAELWGSASTAIRLTLA